MLRWKAKHPGEPAIGSAPGLVTLAEVTQAAGRAVAELHQAGPRRPGPLDAALRPLATALRDQQEAVLRAIVQIWVEQTAPLFAIACLMRDAGELRARSHAIAAAFEQMTASIAEVARTALRLADQARAVDASLTQGVASAGEAMTAMQAIVGAFDALAGRAAALDQASGQTALRGCDMPDHHGGRLGRWYDAVDLPGLRGLPAFQRLSAPHERVHAHGRQALDSHAAGDLAAAVAAAAAMDDASQEVIGALDERHAAMRIQAARSAA